MQNIMNYPTLLTLSRILMTAPAGAAVKEVIDRFHELEANVPDTRQMILQSIQYESYRALTADACAMMLCETADNDLTIALHGAEVLEEVRESAVCDMPTGKAYELDILTQELLEQWYGEIPSEGEMEALIFSTMESIMARTHDLPLALEVVQYLVAYHLGVAVERLPGEHPRKETGRTVKLARYAIPWERPHSSAYTPKGNQSTTQTVLIPKLVKDYSGYIKLKKVDETGQPLPGAVFGIYTDEACTDRLATITTTTDEWNYSGELKLDSKTQTLWVKELTAPPDYYPNAKPWPVTVDATVNNTKENAAAVNDGNAIKNRKDTPEGVIYKVGPDGNAIGPVTFKFYSIEHDTDRTITSETGVIELQWIDPAKDNYIEPGEYRVTEEKAPPGYVKSDEAQNIKFWVEWDDDGLPILMHSGPLTFENELMRKVKVMKVDQNDAPLSGAVFAIYKDGVHIDDATTGRDGSFTYAGLDGNGLESGYYDTACSRFPQVDQQMLFRCPRLVRRHSIPLLHQRRL